MFDFRRQYSDTSVGIAERERVLTEATVPSANMAAKTKNPMSTTQSRRQLVRAKSAEIIRARSKVSSAENTGGHGIRKRVARRNMPKKELSSSTVAMLKKEEEYISVPPLPPPGEGVPLKPIFILIGSPGTGKHAQGSNISEFLQLAYVTEQDILTAFSTKGASAPLDFSKAGEDDVGVAIDIIQDQLNSAKCLEMGIILEGFPQTMQQAEAFTSLIDNHGSYAIAAILVLEACEKIVLSRACGRWVHKASGRAYHEKFHPPKSLHHGMEVSPQTMLDDITGEKLQPVDDSIKKRLKDRLATYQENTPPMLEFLGLVDLLVFRISVNFYKTDDDIWGEIVPIVLSQASSLRPRKDLQPFVPNVEDRRAIKDFALWALDHWDHLYMLFEVPERTDPTKTSCRTVSFKEFAEYLRSNGFKGDTRRAFRILTAEGPVGALDDEQISLAQVKRFGRRKSVVNAAIKYTKLDSELGSQFIKLLKYQHGTVFRGWRLDVDLRGNGNVDYTEFSRACIRLGLADKAKGIWACFRPLAFDAVPLTLQDVSKEEHNQIAEFMDVLQEKVGFDLDEAWTYIDKDGSGFITAEEFETGLRDLGFHGDAQLLFRGLDTPGLGKLWRHEFDYFSVLRKAPRRQKKIEKRNRDSLEYRPTLRPMLRGAKDRVAFSERPNWDGTVDMTWRKNLEHQAHQRNYFSDLAIKPVRTEIRRKLLDTAARIEQEKSFRR